MTNNNGATPEQLNALSKPVPAQQIKTDDKRNKYATARFIMNRLDSTVGKANWRDSYRVVPLSEKITVECTLYIRIDGEWVGKSDVGTEKTYSPEKSLYSSALKRAAFRWGIARELYGEGNYYIAPGVAETDDAPEAPATSPPPTSLAGDAVEPPEDDAHTPPQDVGEQWDADRVRKMLAYAQTDLWTPAGMDAATGAHGYERIAVALKFRTPNGSPIKLAQTLTRENMNTLTATTMLKAHAAAFEANRAAKPDAEGS